MTGQKKEQRKNAGNGEERTEAVREPEFTEEQKEAAEKLKETLDGGCTPELAEKLVWEALLLFQDTSFYTSKGLEFTYHIKGNEIFISRKEKSITRATVMLALRKALELERIAAGPKKLGCFGASYLYPVFGQIGVLRI